MTIQAPMAFDDASMQRIPGEIDMRPTWEGMFHALADGSATQPAQTLSLFPNDAGDFTAYLGGLASGKAFGAKLPLCIPGDGQALAAAWTVLMPIKTGSPLLFRDPRRLPTERTAAAAALAVDLLAREDASILAAVGAGAVGLARLRHGEGLRPWRKARLCSPSAGAKAGLAEKLANGAPVVAFTNADEAPAGADQAVLCAPSGSPAIDAARLHGDAFVASIGANATNAREVEPAALSGLATYCGHRAATLASAGGMKLASAVGTWGADRLLRRSARTRRGARHRPAGSGRAFSARSVLVSKALPCPRRPATGPNPSSRRSAR